MFRGTRNLYAVVEAHRRQIDRQVGAAMREMASVWDEVLRRVQVDLNALLKEMRGGRVTQGQLFRLRQYQDLERVIRQQVSVYAGRSARITTGAQSRMIALSAGHVAEFVGKRLANPDVVAVRKLVGFLGNGSPLSDLFAEIGPDAVTTARNVLAEALAQGRNSREIRKQLDLELGLRNRNRAETIAQTELMRSYRESTHERFKANAEILNGWQWTCALDGRVCPICLGRHGSIHPLSARMQTHPRCRCRQIPIIDGVPPIIEETGDQWLRRQPEVVQRQILVSPGRFEAWKGGVELESMIEVVDRGRWGPQPRLVPLKHLNDRDAIERWRHRVPPKEPFQLVNERVETIAGGAKIRASASLLDQPSGSWVRGALRESAAMIDDLHRVSGATRTPVYDRVQGVPDQVLGFYSPPDDVMFIKPFTDEARAVVLHEYGHKISLQAIGDGLSAVSLGDAFEEWRSAVKSSDAIQRLMALRYRKTMRVKLPSQEEKDVDVPLDHVAYLLLWEEIWARAYTQWVLTRSASNLAKAELVKLRAGLEAVYFSSQWDDGDFAPIALAIDRIMEKLGWKRRARRNG